MAKIEMDIDVLFLGGLFSLDEQEAIFSKSRGVMQFAANALQWNIVRGLDQNIEKPINIVNSIFVGSFPKYYKDLIIKSNNWSHILGSKDKNIGFINIFGIKQIIRSIGLSIHARKWASNVNEKKKIIIIYSIHTPFLFAAFMAKNINPDIRICLIVPDLPKFMQLASKVGFLTKVGKKLDNLIMKIMIPSVDYYVLLTKYIAEYLKIYNKPWIVMEGMVNPDFHKIEEETYTSSKGNNNSYPVSILYSGTLNRSYGIINLLNAFKIIENPNINLWICGAGEAEHEIKSISAVDHRIRYFGQVTHCEALRLQQQADVLINPRTDEGEFTKYSFPSKILEYMLAGKSTIIYKLPGIPDEYFNYVFTITGEGSLCLAKKIEEVCSLGIEELEKRGMMAREFVLTKKNYLIQTKRIIDLVYNNWTCKSS